MESQNAKILPLAGLDRVILRNEVPLCAPFSAYIFPTTYCNFRCVYCGHKLSNEEYQATYGFPLETMEMETYWNTIDQLSEFPSRLKTLSLTGQGEPLLHPQLPEMIAYAKQKNVSRRIEFITNGALLRQPLAQALVDAGTDGIRISLQGLSSRKYREVCGTDVDFDVFREQIAWLYQHKKQCEIFVKILDIALEPGEDQRFYELFSPIADRVYIEQCRPVYSEVAQAEWTAEADRYGRAHSPRNVCPLCFFMLSVFPNGDVFPCDAIYRPVCLGNIHSGRLIEMWNGEALRGFWRLQLREGRHANSRCARCCAPDDVSHPEDVLDEAAQQILERLERQWD